MASGSADRASLDCPYLSASSLDHASCYSMNCCSGPWFERLEANSDYSGCSDRCLGSAVERDSMAAQAVGLGPASEAAPCFGPT